MDRSPNSGGISPLNSLLSIRSPRRLYRLPNSGGICPVNSVGVGGSTVAGGTGHRAPAVSYRSNGCHRDLTIPDWTGCPTPAVSYRSARCSSRRSHCQTGQARPAPAVSPRLADWLSRLSVSRLDNSPSSGGICPLNSLPSSRSSLAGIYRSSNSFGIGPLKLVGFKVQPRQIGQVAQLRRYLPAQLVAVEPRSLQG